MVSLDSVDDNGLLAITTGELGADDGMRALDVVVNCLAQVVKQTGALGGHNVQAKLGSHHAAEIRDLEGVLKHVLTKRGTVAQGTKGLDDLGVQVVDASIEGSLLASLAHALLNQVGSLVIHLLDAGRVNAAVGDEVLEGDTGGLTTDRVEARKNDGLGRVVDHEVDAGNLLEGADVATLATDNTALEVIRGNVHGGNGDLGSVVGSAALNRQGQNLLGGLVALGANLLLGLANDRGGLVGDLAANLIEELLVGILAGKVGDTLELGGLLCAELLELTGALLDLTGLTGQLMLALVESVVAAIKGFLALHHAVLSVRISLLRCLSSASAACLFLMISS